MTLPVEAAKPFAELLVENLKALNAKERDHLMRFAYLGETGPYDKEIKRWLSDEMTAALLTKTGFSEPENARCVFAGMDYHLDWIHAALTLSCLGVAVSDAFNQKKPTPYSCDELAICGEKDDVTLRPISGRQEDVDLAVVFTNGGETVLLFIEAKGVASVDNCQLARKLIRLDRILESSRALEHEFRLNCKFVLVAPEWAKERPESVIDFAKRCKLLEPLINGEKHMNGIGKGDINFVELSGFPSRNSLGKVTRIPIDGRPGEYTQWRVGKR